MHRAWFLIGAALFLAIGFAGGSALSNSNGRSGTATGTTRCVLGPGAPACELAETARIKRICRSNVSQVKLTTVIEDTYRGVTTKTTNTYPC